MEFISGEKANIVFNFKLKRHHAGKIERTSIKGESAWFKNILKVPSEFFLIFRTFESVLFWSTSLSGEVSVTGYCNYTVWPLWRIVLEAWRCRFSGLLGSKAEANTQIRSHWTSSKRSVCAPGLLWKSWPTVKSWKSARLLRSAWSRRRDTLEIPAKSTHFFMLQLNYSSLFYLLSIWARDHGAASQAFKALQMFQKFLWKHENICSFSSKNAASHTL